MLAILDELATRENETASLDELVEQITTVTSFDDREEAINLLDLMQKDHYVTKGTDGRYAFRFL